jgi:REP element-mobilizing transposase RayT
MANKRKDRAKRRAARRKQLQFHFRTHGGKRKGAGRKRLAALPMVSHSKRPEITGRQVALVTSRILPHMASLRTKDKWKVVRRSIQRGCERFGMRLIEFSVQGNHLHFLCEADDARALSRGMQGLGVRIAKGLNRVLDTRGKVVADRYHSRVLSTPLEVRRALAYVLNNARKHARFGQPAPGWIDAEYSSAAWFRGWKSRPARAFSDEFPSIAAQPASWLLRVGWRIHGLIDMNEIPSSGMTLTE